MKAKDPSSRDMQNDFKTLLKTGAGTVIVVASIVLAAQEAGAVPAKPAAEQKLSARIAELQKVMPQSSAVGTLSQPQTMGFYNYYPFYNFPNFFRNGW